MTEGKDNSNFEKVRNRLFRHSILKCLILCFAAYASCLFSTAFSAVVVSEVFVDTTTKNLQYVELTNINNKDQTLNRLELSNGNASVYVNDTVTFAPYEIKIVLFPDFVPSDSIENDSTQRILSKSSLKIYDMLLMKLDSAETCDTFFINDKVFGCTERNKVLVDETFGVVSSNFRYASPSPLKENMTVRMKKVLAYSYDNSGNRIKLASKVIYVEEKKEEAEEKEKENPQIIIDEGEKHPGFNVYPNPTKGDVIVEMPEVGDYTIRLFNLKSAGLLTKEIVNNNTVEINMSDLSFGIYLITVYKGNEIIGTVKIIKNC